MKKTDDPFYNPWEELVESLTKGQFAKIALKERGIEICQTGQHIKIYYKEGNRGIPDLEFNVLAKSEIEEVLIQVRMILKLSDVKVFLESLKVFTKIYPRDKGLKLHGAVAYLRSASKVTEYAEKQGLFVIRVTEDSASVVNEKGFQPKVFR